MNHGKCVAEVVEQLSQRRCLNGAGKTITLYKLKLGEVVSTIPTVGFNVESGNYKNVKSVSLAIGGRNVIHPLWRNYYRNTQVVIFVIDSDDNHFMISEWKDELWGLLEEEELKNAIVLVMANKQDLPNAISVEELSHKLEIEKIRDRTIRLSWVQTTLAQRALKNTAVEPVNEVLATLKGKSKSYLWRSAISNYFMHTPTKDKQ